MKLLKKCCAILLVMVLGIALVACGGRTSAKGSKNNSEGISGDDALQSAIKKVLEEKEEVNISFWTSTSQVNFPYLQAIVDAFQEEYPNIHVDMAAQGAVNDLMDKLTQNVVSKTTPTISNLNPTYFSEYINSDAIIDLMPYYADAKIGFTDSEKETFYPFYIDEVMSFGEEGTMYGFPTNKKTADILFYNKTYFDTQDWEAPTTWDEVIDYSKRIKEDTGMAGFSYDVAYAEAAFKLMSMQWGSPYIDSEGNVSIDNEASRQALNFYKKNFDAGYFTMPSEMPSAGGGNYSNKGFVVKECYMFVGASAGMPYSLPKAEAGQEVFEVGAAAIPQKDVNNRIAFSKGEDYCIFSNASAQERVAAWLLIKFMSGDDQNVEWYTFTGNLPITSTILENSDYQEFLNKSNDGSGEYYRSAAVNAALDMMDYMKNEQFSPITASLATECGEMWKAVIIGGADIDESIANVVVKVTK